MIDQVRKRCQGCKLRLPGEQFAKNRTKKHGLDGQCRACASKRLKRYRKTRKCKRWARLYYDKNQVKLRAYGRRYWTTEAGKRAWLRGFHMTMEQYTDELKKRHGKCDACRGANPNKSRKYKKLCLDHCHERKAFRGFLCSSCNLALGLADNRPEVLRGLADYLERTRAITNGQ